jgi:hypothetical protein
MLVSWALPIDTPMPRSKAPKAINSSVTREEAERLQVLLFRAAARALEKSLEEDSIQASTISAAHQLLKESGLVIDLSAEEDNEEAAASPNWLLSLQNDLGL